MFVVVNLFSKGVNFYSKVSTSTVKTIVNHIRKRVNCQPKSGKDREYSCIFLIEIIEIIEILLNFTTHTLLRRYVVPRPTGFQ